MTCVHGEMVCGQRSTVGGVHGRPPGGSVAAGENGNSDTFGKHKLATMFDMKTSIKITQ